MLAAQDCSSPGAHTVVGHVGERLLEIEAADCLQILLRGTSSSVAAAPATKTLRADSAMLIRTRNHAAPHYNALLVMRNLIADEYRVNGIHT